MNYQPSRSQFLAGASGAIALATSLVRADETVAQSSNKSIIKPAVLKKGDKVGMVAPASYSFEPEDIKIAKEVSSHCLAIWIFSRKRCRKSF
jgi:muramoyltetrapeptide carboxypeptidase